MSIGVVGKIYEARPHGRAQKGGARAASAVHTVQSSIENFLRLLQIFFASYHNITSEGHNIFQGHF